MGVPKGNVVFTVLGQEVKVPIDKWERAQYEHGITQHIFRGRLARGWTIAEALNIPKGKMKISVEEHFEDEPEEKSECKPTKKAKKVMPRVAKTKYWFDTTWNQMFKGW